MHRPIDDRRSASGTANDRFNADILPHLEGAYSLARLLARNEHDAEDIVQDALVRAMRFIDGQDGANARGWLLAIVRNTAYTWLKRNRSEELTPMDEDAQATDHAHAAPDAGIIDAEHRHLVRIALERLPIHLREVLLLREVEELSYKTIAEVIQAPIGTVMSRLARGREQLCAKLSTAIKEAGA